MKQEADIIKLAKLKNGREFEKWLEAKSTNVPDIEKVREITKKVPYSMAQATSD